MNEPPKDKRTKEYKQWLKDNHQGLGDKVDYMLNETPLKNVTKIIKKALFKDGEDCGCDKRQEWLNEKTKNWPIYKKRNIDGNNK